MKHLEQALHNAIRDRSADMRTLHRVCCFMTLQELQAFRAGCASEKVREEFLSHPEVIQAHLEKLWAAFTPDMEAGRDWPGLASALDSVMAFVDTLPVMYANFRLFVLYHQLTTHQRQFGSLHGATAIVDAFLGLPVDFSDLPRVKRSRADVSFRSLSPPPSAPAYLRMPSRTDVTRVLKSALQDMIAHGVDTACVVWVCCVWLLVVCGDGRWCACEGVQTQSNDACFSGWLDEGGCVSPLLCSAVCCCCRFFRWVSLGCAGFVSTGASMLDSSPPKCCRGVPRQSFCMVDTP